MLEKYLRRASRAHAVTSKWEVLAETDRTRIDSGVSEAEGFVACELSLRWNGKDQARARLLVQAENEQDSNLFKRFNECLREHQSGLRASLSYMRKADVIKATARLHPEGKEFADLQRAVFESDSGRKHFYEDVIGFKNLVDTHYPKHFDFVLFRDTLWSLNAYIAKADVKQLLTRELSNVEDSLASLVHAALATTTARARIPEAVRSKVWRRDEGRCTLCGSRTRLEFDHIVPFSLGGSDTSRNVELLCELCNRSKGARI